MLFWDGQFDSLDVEPNKRSVATGKVTSGTRAVPAPCGFRISATWPFCFLASRAAGSITRRLGRILAALEANFTHRRPTIATPRNIDNA
eukprot:5355775-Prymnesium_polylepis.2